MKRRGGLDKPGQRVLLWDPNKDHQAHQFDKLSEYARTVARAVRSGRGYRIAYVGEPGADSFEIWASIMWEVLDGNHLTFGLVEEYSDCCRGPGSLKPFDDYCHRKLWTQGRKYGAVIHATSQRPQLISKDALGNAGIIWASAMDTLAAKRIAAEMDIRADLLRACQVGEFFYRNNGAAAEKIKVFDPI